MNTQDIPRLKGYVGGRRAKRYAFLSAVLFVVIFYALLVDSIAGQLLDSYYTDLSLEDPLLLSAILSTFITRALILHIETELNIILNLLMSLIFSLIGVIFILFWCLILLIPVTIVYAIISFVIGAASGVDVGIETQMSLIFMSASAVSIWRIGAIFPEEMQDDVTHAHEILDKVEETLQEDPGDNTPNAELQEYENAYRELNTLKEHRSQYTGVAERVADVEEQLRSKVEEALEQTIATGKTHLEAGNYQKAAEAISTAKAAIEQYDISESNVSHLEHELKSEATEIADEEGEKMAEAIQNAQEARHNGNLDVARHYLETADEAYHEIQNLPINPDLDRLRQELQTLRHALARDEKQQKIKKFKESISSLLDVPISKIEPRSQDEPLDAYEDLLWVAEKIEESPYPSLPWTEFEAGLKADLPASPERIAEYRGILSDVEMIKSYLAEVSHTHPSVRPEEWNDAISTAMTHQFRDILNPITASIRRLKSGDLWDKDDLYTVNPVDFEHLIGALYEDQGYNVEVTQGTADLGVDVWAEKNGEKIAIQVKQNAQDNTVGRQILQKLSSHILTKDADRMIVVTSGYFARTAEDWAAEFGPRAELINGDELVQLFSESSISPPT